MYTDYLVDINILFKENLTVALKYLDKVLLMKYVSRGRNPFDLRKAFDDLVTEIEGFGLHRPLLIEKWLQGEYSAKQCHELVCAAIDEKLTNRPKSTTLKLMKDVSAITFQAEKLSRIVQVNDTILKRIKVLHERECRIYLFGNMDVHTYRLLRVLHKDIFSLITDCFISGEHGILKPESEFYRSMVDRLGINVFKTFLVDNTEVDLERAKFLGFFGASSDKWGSSA